MSSLLRFCLGRKHSSLLPICIVFRRYGNNSSRTHFEHTLNVHPTSLSSNCNLKFGTKLNIKQLSNKNELFQIISRKNSSLSTAGSGKMARVIEKFPMDIPRRKVWRVLSDFGNLDWQPNTVDKIETVGNGIGMTRIVHVKGISHPLKEKLLTMNHDDYNLSFEIDTNWVLPFGNYSITCNVERVDNKKCIIHWIGEFEVLGMEEQEGAKMAAGIYKQMFRDLPSYISKQPDDYFLGLPE